MAYCHGGPLPLYLLSGGWGRIQFRMPRLAVRRLRCAMGTALTRLGECFNRELQKLSDWRPRTQDPPPDVFIARLVFNNM